MLYPNIKLLFVSMHLLGSNPYKSKSLVESGLDWINYIEKQILKLVLDGRELLYAGFNRLGLKFIESQANFIFVEVGDGDKISNELMSRGIIVRPGSFFKNKEWIRVTVGNSEEIRIFLEKLKEILP